MSIQKAYFFHMLKFFLIFKITDGPIVSIFKVVLFHSYFKVLFLLYCILVAALCYS